MNTSQHWLVSFDRPALPSETSLTDQYAVNKFAKALD